MKITPIVVAILVVWLLATAGCTSGRTHAIETDAAIHNTTEELYKPIEYGNGVYYFPCYESAFGYSMSVFIAEHPELSIVAVAPNDNGLQGRPAGYFVITTAKK